MPDCRLVLDNLNDYAALQGPLVTGSDVVDIAQARMTQGPEGWRVFIKTVAPAQQHPRLQVSTVVYLDVDGRVENNAAAGPRLGADTVYGIVSGPDGWQITREAFNAKDNAFLTVTTNATFSVESDGYAINIPYGELAKDVPAYWKVGVAEKDSTRLTADYAPDGGLACTPSISRESSWMVFTGRAKSFFYSNIGDQILAGAVAIIAVAVLFWKWKKSKKIR